MRLYISYECPHSVSLIKASQEIEIDVEIEVVDILTKPYPEFVHRVPTLVVGDGGDGGDGTDGEGHHVGEAEIVRELRRLEQDGVLQRRADANVNDQYNKMLSERKNMT